MSYNQYIPFLVKSLIGGVIVAMLGLFLINVAANQAENSVSRIKEQITMANYFPGQGKLSAAGERLAVNLQEMTPQRPIELIAMLRAIVRELRPVAIELWPLLIDTHAEQRKSFDPQESQ